MSSEERLEYVSCRIKSAYKTYEAAKVLAETGFWNSAVNRLYYAVFYAVNALLVKNEIFTGSHTGMRSQFSLHFIKTGKLDKNLVIYFQNSTIGGKKVIMTTFSIMTKHR
jgi:uncharacterized protein (UPF0332 family)